MKKKKSKEEKNDEKETPKQNNEEVPNKPNRKAGSSKEKSEKPEKPKKKKKSSSTDNKANKSQLTASSKLKKQTKQKQTVSSSISEVNDPKTTVLNYMLSQNRPYSLINVFDNLRGSIKKAQLGKILDALTEEKKLICKEYNTKIYLANQDNFPPVSEESLKGLDASIEASKEEITKLKETLQGKQNELKTITSEYTDEELNQHIKNAKRDLESLESKVKKIESNTLQLIPEEKMVEEEKKFENEKNKYKKLKRVCLDILDQLSEGLEMKTSALMEQIGIENDTELLNQYKIKI